jgi:hypothetical protein
MQPGVWWGRLFVAVGKLCERWQGYVKRYFFCGFGDESEFFDLTSQTFLLHFATHHAFLRLLQPSPTRW